MSQVVLGGFEKVSMVEFGLHEVVAKIDTGAFSGALHCDDMRVVTKNGRPHLQFNVLGKAYETREFEQKHVRSATGHRVKRYLVSTSIMIGTATYPITIGLSDRSKMKCSILIGRRFLREQNMLVDVQRNTELDDEGDQIV